MDHLSLVFFTVFAQASIGLFIVLGVLHLSVTPKNSVLSKGFLFVWPLFGIALLCSLTHLGQPLRAFNVLSGVTHGSPLSIEIISSIAFGSFGFIFTVLEWFKLGSDLFRKVLLFISMIVGCWLLMAISNVYTLDGVMAWANALTPIQFFSTALILGVTGTIAIINLMPKTTKGAPAIRIVTLSLFGVGLLISMAVFAAFLLHIGKEGLIPQQLHSYIAVVKVMFTLIGAALCVVYVIKPEKHNSMVKTVSMCVGVLLLITSELSGRVMFYDMYYITGM
ncbi:dimethyl sulfoxide reductase anchor subunit family protein [Vibrio sinensis]|nr:DmsC/YnfH family molybdoenzyme membrane anchor subunit [Vibrio sinensis]